MKALILGARGQVGTDIVLTAPLYNIQALAYGSKELDVTDLEALERVVHQLQPDIIINASAYTAVDKAESESEQAYLVNHTGAENIGKVAKKSGAPVLHISTDYVYAGDKETAYIETDRTAPLGVYGASKLAGEEALSRVCPESLILRTAWVYGCHGNNFVKTMLRLAAQRDELSVVSDQYGCPTYSADIAHTLLKIVKHYQRTGNLAWGVYHYSGSDPVSWYDFANQIFTLAKQQGLLSKVPNVKPIVTDEYPTPAKRPHNSRLDCGKILSNFPEVDLSRVDKGVMQLVEFLGKQ